MIVRVILHSTYVFEISLMQGNNHQNNTITAAKTKVRCDLALLFVCVVATAERSRSTQQPSTIAP